MGMQLNIKSDEAYALATRLAELTGENRTTAVTDLLREKVTELERKQDAQERVKRVMAIAAEMRAEILKNGHSLDFNTDELYDPDTGLPV
jgi:antitoxin VapB